MNPLLKKLKVKPNQKLLIINAPEGYLLSLAPTTDFEILNVLAFADVIQLFVKNGEELKIEMEKINPFLTPQTILWISYPKKSSGIETDLGMMHHWDELKKFQLRPVASIAINNHWTALQIKNEAQIKPSTISKAAISETDLSVYINQENRTVKLPEDILTALNNEPISITFFESLSFTNKKEYVVWVLTAKQEKTRLERIEKMKEKLSLRKKNPSEK